MGFSHEAYVAYGVHVPVSPYRSDDTGQCPSEQVDQALAVPAVKKSCPDVGHLQAGDYDVDLFFLVTHCESAALGKYHRLDEFTHHQLANWDEQLEAALHIMGWDRKYELERPSWFVVADLS